METEEAMRLTESKKNDQEVIRFGKYEGGGPEKPGSKTSNIAIRSRRGVKISRR